MGDATSRPDGGSGSYGSIVVDDDGDPDGGFGEALSHAAAHLLVAAERRPGQAAKMRDLAARLQLMAALAPVLPAQPPRRRPVDPAAIPGRAVAGDTEVEMAGAPAFLTVSMTPRLGRRHANDR